MIGALHEDMMVEDWGYLCLFLGGSPDSFTGKLLELVAKADTFNRAKLRHAFPREVVAWTVWVAHAPLTAKDLDDKVKAFIDALL